MIDTSLLDLSTADGIVSAFMEHGITPADAKGITADELEAVYDELCMRVADEQFSPALDLAHFLITHQPWDRRFVFAFALCLQQLGDYSAAARHFSEAYTMDMTDAGCAYRIGECMEALRDFDAAREAYKSALDLSFIGTGMPEIRDAAQARLDGLEASA
jgi:tetratricopeptide (TPR) repeat protein